MKHKKPYINVLVIFACISVTCLVTFLLTRVSHPPEPVAPAPIQLQELTIDRTKEIAASFLTAINFPATKDELSPWSEGIRNRWISYSRNFSHEYQFGIGKTIHFVNGKSAEKGYIYVDAISGRVNEFASSILPKKSGALPETTLIKKVVDFAKLNQTYLTDPEFHLTENTLYHNCKSNQDCYDFVWEKTDMKTHILLPCYVSAQITTSGYIFSYIDDYLPVTVSLIPKVNVETAESIAISNFANKYHVGNNNFISDGKSFLSIGSDPDKTVGAKQTLVWNINLSINWSQKHTFNLSTIGASYVIDAFTGKILFMQDMGIPIEDRI